MGVDILFTWSAEQHCYDLLQMVLSKLTTELQLKFLLRRCIGLHAA